MNSPLLKPNIIALAFLSVLLVAFLAYFSPAEHQLAVIGIASVVAGGFVAVMFALSAPPPNPDVDAAFAADVIALVSGTGSGGKAAEMFIGREMKALFGLILLAALLSALSLVMPGIPDSVSVGLTNATVGMIGATVGKLVDPPPDKQVPQSVVLAALKQVAETKAGK